MIILGRILQSFYAVATGNGPRSLVQMERKLVRLPGGAVRAVLGGPVPTVSTVLSWIRQWNVGPCSCPVSKKEIGDFWFEIAGCNTNSISNIVN